MTQTIKISSKEMELINDLLNLPGDEIYQKYGYKQDETITHTAKFSNGIEADIKLVICEEEAPYTEGVLFHNGFELTCTEPDYTYDGGWNIKSIREVVRVGYSIFPKKKTTDFTMNMSVFLLVKLRQKRYKINTDRKIKGE